MSIATLVDPGQYSKLLSETLPTVIHTEEQNQRYISLLENLYSNDSLSPEEIELGKLLTLLIEDFEGKYYTLQAATPLEALQELMEAHGLRQLDLLDVFGTPSIVSEVINGKRKFTTEHIVKLASRFHVSPELFLPAG